mmetsp:Transcript_8256/g.12700  ORF Transcript_8256/g.12700 Transcript_8256/m.12700 type:complete len:110 (-) Transcript_8256:31-360(-)
MYWLRVRTGTGYSIAKSKLDSCHIHPMQGMPIWAERKISEPWKTDDVLTFKVDINENDIVFQKEGASEETFWNVLAFTNNRKSQIIESIQSISVPLHIVVDGAKLRKLI